MDNCTLGGKGRGQGECQQPHDRHCKQRSMSREFSLIHNANLCCEFNFFQRGAKGGIWLICSPLTMRMEARGMTSSRTTATANSAHASAASRPSRSARRSRRFRVPGSRFCSGMPPANECLSRRISYCSLFPAPADMFPTASPAAADALGPLGTVSAADAACRRCSGVLGS